MFCFMLDSSSPHCSPVSPIDNHRFACSHVPLKLDKKLARAQNVNHVHTTRVTAAWMRGVTGKLRK